MATEIHLVSKEDITKHTTLSVELPAPGALAASSIRARTRVFGLTANNFFYAMLGGMLHWWDTYPVPAGLPSPYDDSEKWGVVPAWGFAEVEESTIEAIPKGSWLWGFWPTSTHQVELKLESAAEDGHFVEVSEGRKRVKPLYQAYKLIGSPPPEETLGWTATNFAIWGAGYMLNRYVFAEDPSKAVHPQGDGPWTKEDADLTSAVVVTLSSTSKTGISFAWNLAQRDQASGPLALLQASSSAAAIPKIPSDRLKTKAVSYEDLDKPAVAEWLAELNPSRIVIVDFGSPAGAIERFGEAALTKLPATTPFTIVPVGAQPALPTGPPPTPANPKFAVNPSLILDTSNVTEIAIAQEGLQDSYNRKSQAFQKWLSEKGMGDMQLLWGEGISGERGVHKAWEDLCSGDLPRQRALVFKLNG